MFFLITPRTRAWFLSSLLWAYCSPTWADLREAVLPLLLPYIAVTDPLELQNLDIHIRPLDERRLKNCPSDSMHIFLPPGAGIQSRTTFGVQCQVPNTTETWTTYVPFEIHIQKNVIALNKALNRGDLIEGSTSWIRANILTLKRGYFDNPSALQQQVANRPLKMGHILSPSDVQKMKLISRGQIVGLIAKKGALSVTAQGRALADGGSGDPIRVENLNTQRIVQGTVTAGGSVEILF